MSAEAFDGARVAKEDSNFGGRCKLVLCDSMSPYAYSYLFVAVLMLAALGFAAAPLIISARVRRPW